MPRAAKEKTTKAAAAAAARRIKQKERHKELSDTHLGTNRIFRASMSSKCCDMRIETTTLSTSMPQPSTEQVLSLAAETTDFPCCYKTRKILRNENFTLR